MNLFQRIIAPTPNSHKVEGAFAGTIATTSGALLATGVVTNPIAIGVLTVITAILGGKTVYHAQQTN